jgi:glutathione reductase (NADPH)
MAAGFLDQLADAGITFKENVSIEKVSRSASGQLVLSGNGGFEMTTDFAVAGVGRIANTDQLNLEAVGVVAGAHGIAVNDFLQTANPAIYAMGDVLSKRIAHLTPVSFFEAKYLGHNLTTDGPQPIHYPAIPSVIYGASKLAEIGQLAGEGINVKTLDLTSWYTYKRIADPYSKAKIAVNEKGEIVGASIVSTVAEELSNLLMLLIETKLPAEKFQTLITAYPTVASDLGYLY